jgi:hypothetical protein
LNEVAKITKNSAQTIGHYNALLLAFLANFEHSEGVKLTKIDQVRDHGITEIKKKVKEKGVHKPSLDNVTRDILRSHMPKELEEIFGDKRPTYYQIQNLLINHFFRNVDIIYNNKGKGPGGGARLDKPNMYAYLISGKNFSDIADIEDGQKKKCAVNTLRHYNTLLISLLADLNLKKISEVSRRMTFLKKKAAEKGIQPDSLYKVVNDIADHQTIDDLKKILKVDELTESNVKDYLWHSLIQHFVKYTYEHVPNAVVHENIKRRVKKDITHTDPLISEHAKETRKYIS